MIVNGCSKVQQTEEPIKKETKIVHKNFRDTGLTLTISKPEAPSDWVKDDIFDGEGYEFEIVDEIGTIQMKTYFVYNVDAFNTGSVIQYTENMTIGLVICMVLSLLCIIYVIVGVLKRKDNYIWIAVAFAMPPITALICYLNKKRANRSLNT